MMKKIILLLILIFLVGCDMNIGKYYIAKGKFNGEDIVCSEHMIKD